MRESDVLLSAIVDQAIASELLPRQCPSDFGPGDRYRLEELVAAGRGGFVYRATDRLLSSDGFEATVAVKIVSTSMPRSEALAARRIDHPFVLAMIDRGELPEGGSYFVSEYVDGGDLSSTPVPLPPRDAAALVSRLASAIQAAHSAGIVHCDLKPSNVMLTRDGRPKLCDFGLARWELDEPGATRGNAAFTSPEQFAGATDALTPPADIYALGGLLYWLLTARMPHGATPDLVAAFHRDGSKVPAPGADPDLDAICRRATDPSRSQRYQAASQLHEDLERWLNHEPIAWTNPSPIRRARLFAARRPWWVAAALAVSALLVVASATWRYNAVQDRKREKFAQIEALRIAQEKVDETKKRAQRLLESWIQQANASREPEILLAALPWLEWLGAAPVLTQSGAIPAADERASLLRAHIRSTIDAGGGRLDTLLSKYALAHLLVGLDEPDEAAGLLTDVREQLLPRLSGADPLRTCVEALDACISYLKATDEQLAAAVLTLESADTALANIRGTLATRQLIARVRGLR